MFCSFFNSMHLVATQTGLDIRSHKPLILENGRGQDAAASLRRPSAAMMP